MPRAAARQKTIAVHHVDDETRLRQLGYKQELRRELSLLKNFAVSFGWVRRAGLGEGGAPTAPEKNRGAGPAGEQDGPTLRAQQPTPALAAARRLLSMLTGLGGYYSFGFSYGGPVIPVWGWPLIVAMVRCCARARPGAGCTPLPLPCCGTAAGASYASRSPLRLGF